MGSRLKLLSKVDHDTLQAELAVLAERALKIANIIGPAYGAAWCDKGLKLHRTLQSLSSQIEGEYRRRGESS